VAINIPSLRQAQDRHLTGLKKISKKLSPALDIAIFISYVSRDYDEHLFAF